MGRSILLADDSATIRKVVEMAFSDTGFHVEAVASGEEALARLEILQPDLVLADVVMPDPSGYEICRRIKGSDRPVPVLLLAGTFEAFDHERARQCGADGCLMKPFDSRTLLERVESLLAGRRLMAEEAVELLEGPAAGGAASAEESEAPTLAETDTTVPADALTEELALPLSSEQIDAISRAVLRRLSEDVVRRIAKEVVPEVAETLVRQKIRELENEDS